MLRQRDNTAELSFVFQSRLCLRVRRRPCKAAHAGWDRANETVPKGENQCVYVCNVKAEAQCPRCIRGKV